MVPTAELSAKLLAARVLDNEGASLTLVTVIENAWLVVKPPASVVVTVTAYDV